MTFTRNTSILNKLIHPYSLFRAYLEKWVVERLAQVHLDRRGLGVDPSTVGRVLSLHFALVYFIVTINFGSVSTTELVLSKGKPHIPPYGDRLVHSIIYHKLHIFLEEKYPLLYLIYVIFIGRLQETETIVSFHT